MALLISDLRPGSCLVLASNKESRSESALVLASNKECRSRNAVLVLASDKESRSKSAGYDRSAISRRDRNSTPRLVFVGSHRSERNCNQWIHVIQDFVKASVLLNLESM
jgi:hypothetical protein